MKKIALALVGRPNVGKSTLFNRLVGKRQAIVHNMPGLTRDRLYGEGSYLGRQYTLVDTGGLESFGNDSLFTAVEKQAEFAITEADVVILLMDIRQGILPKDRDLLRGLLRSGKPVVCAANKADTPQISEQIAEFYGLGVEEPVAIAAEHGRGISELMDQVLAQFPDWEATLDEDEENPPIRISIIGRPNVGKSSFVNAVLEDDRVIVSDQAGTTRDPIDSNFSYAGRNYVFTDTAGIRRKGKVDQAVEKFSVIKALQGLKRADIALTLVDASEGITDQDLTIAGYAQDEGCASLILVNKWDMIKEESRKKSTEYVYNRFKFMPYAPIHYISALKGKGIDQVLKQLTAVYDEYAKRIPTTKLNKALQEWVANHPPGLDKGKPLKIYYMTQAQTCPPHFLLFMNRPEGMHFSYERFLHNQIRNEFGFTGTPLKLVLRERAKKQLKL